MLFIKQLFSPRYCLISLQTLHQNACFKVVLCFVFKCYIFTAYIRQ